jgi:hypothetical protein
MFDLIQLENAEHATPILLVVFALALNVLLSLILVFAYEKTSRQVSRPDHFIQSLLLLSVVTCTIMQSIGDSLALSFGIFGALAIIRFRTRISDPRDIAFVFATMAVGIACGVHSFVNGTVGTLAFVIIIFFIRISPFGQKSNMVGNLRVDLPLSLSNLPKVENVLKKHTQEYTVVKIRLNTLDENNTRIEYEYKIKLQEHLTMGDITSSLSGIVDAKITRFIFEDNNDQEVL